MLIPYNDPFYYSRRPTLAVPAGQRAADRHRLVARRARPASAADRPAADLRPRAARAHPADRLREPEPLAFSRAPTSGRPPIRRNSAGARLGRPLSRLAAVAGRSAGRLEHDGRVCRACCRRRASAVPAIANAAALRVLEPERRRRSRRRARDGAPHQLPRAGRSAGAGVRLRQRRRRRWRRSIASPSVAAYAPYRHLSRTPASARRCGPSPARWRKAIGTRVFYVTTGGFDTHSAQNVNAANGAYYNLMATLNDGLLAFYNDLQQSGPARGHAASSRFSEFGRRISENGSQRHRPRRRRGDDGDGRHGSTAACTARRRSLNPDPTNPTLENNASDVRYETDFRSVYAQVIDGWLGATRVRCSAATSGSRPQFHLRDDWRSASFGNRVIGLEAIIGRRIKPASRSDRAAIRRQITRFT